MVIRRGIPAGVQPMDGDTGSSMYDPMEQVTLSVLVASNS